MHIARTIRGLAVQPKPDPLPRLEESIQIAVNRSRGLEVSHVEFAADNIARGLIFSCYAAQGISIEFSARVLSNNEKLYALATARVGMQLGDYLRGDTTRRAQEILAPIATAHLVNPRAFYTTVLDFMRCYR